MIIEESEFNQQRWDERAIEIVSTLDAAFPKKQFDQDELDKLIKNAPHSSWIRYADDTLFNFLKILKKLNWAEIDWNNHWTALSFLPTSVFCYCLPGLIRWTLTAPNPIVIPREIVDFNLAPDPFACRNNRQIDYAAFDKKQRDVVCLYLLLVRDFEYQDELDGRQRVQIAIDRISRIES